NEIGVKSFFVGGGTECLINPNIKEMLKKVKEIGKGIDDVLITNGYALTPEITDILIDLQWEKCFISIDAATQETYKRIRGKELKVVEDNVNYLIKRRNERKSIFPIIRVSFCIQEDNY
ncbi:MAG: radical SAM protein, partial [Lachnospiraceae bacterium]|nr:radical SAM protein [Lachnospiraceae bacterium]